MKKQYLLVDITEEISRLNGSTCWHITFLDLDDYSTWEMFVDSCYRNFSRSNWDQVVYAENPYGIYSNLKRSKKTSKRGNGILNADSHPEMDIQVASYEDVIKIIEGLVADVKKDTGKFRELFM